MSAFVGSCRYAPAVTSPRRSNAGPIGLAVVFCIALVAVTTLVGLFLDATPGSIADWIAALGTVGALAAAGVAAFFALEQLRVSRDVQLDQSRPYVTVTMEQSPVDFTAIDVVIRNVGAGPARDVAIRCSPALVRTPPKSGTGRNALDLTDTRYFNERIPLMPPGYELRLFFDVMPARCKGTHASDTGRCLPSDFDECFTFTAQYTDGHGNWFDDTSVQDLGLLHELMFTDLRGAHHAARALEKIAKRLDGAKALNKR